jgi:hypothetical protein
MTNDQACFPRFLLYNNPGSAFPLFPDLAQVTASSINSLVRFLLEFPFADKQSENEITQLAL